MTRLFCVLGVVACLIVNNEIFSLAVAAVAVAVGLIALFSAFAEKGGF